MTAEPRTPDDPRRPWLAAGYAQLSTEGYRGLKLSAVCRRLSVTTGSFYHWFDSWQDYTDALLDDWRRQRTDALVELASRVADPAARLEALLATTESLDLAAEAAIRVWSRVDPAVAEFQAGVDRDRYAVVRDTMRALVGEDEAEHFARWGYSVLVGFEQLSHVTTKDDLVWSLRQVLEAARAAGSGSPRR